MCGVTEKDCLEEVTMEFEHVEFHALQSRHTQANNTEDLELSPHCMK